MAKKSNVRIDIKVERSLLNKKIQSFAKNHNKTTWEVIRMATEWFTQSVIKVTPPLGKVMKKREVILLRTGRFTKRGNEKKRYKVPFRTNKKRGAKYFDKKKDANAFAKIKFRFIGKYGWLAAGQKALGRPIPTSLKVSKEVEAKGDEIQKVFKQRLRLKPNIILTNRVENIGRYARFSVAQALRKTKNRVRRADREITKKLAKQWQLQR